MKQNKWKPEGDRPQVYSGPNCYLFSSSETFMKMPMQGTVGTWRGWKGVMKPRVCSYEPHTI